MYSRSTPLASTPAPVVAQLSGPPPPPVLYSRPLPRLRHTTADLGRLSPNSARVNAIYNQIISSHATTNAVNAKQQQQQHQHQQHYGPRQQQSLAFNKSAIEVADLERYLLSSSSASNGSSSSSLAAPGSIPSSPPPGFHHHHNNSHHHNPHSRQSSSSSLSHPHPHPHPNHANPPPPLNNRNYQEARYKTELCMHFREKSTCPHGARCLFAHGLTELRPYRGRHPKHKTQPCKSFHETGYCNYGYRCSYIHMESPRTINFIKSLNAEAQATRRNFRRAMMFGSGGSGNGGEGGDGGSKNSSARSGHRSGSGGSSASGFLGRGTTSGSSIGSGSSGHTDGSSSFLSNCSN